MSFGERLSNEQVRRPNREEQIEVDFFKERYEIMKDRQPDASEEDIHKTIISGLGYRLDIPGYRSGDKDDPEAKPTEEQQARLEELYDMVVGKSKKEPNAWEIMAQQLAEEQQNQERSPVGGLTEIERSEVDWFKDHYNRIKQRQPDASEEDIHRTIVSGLGYHLDIPGYRSGDKDDPEAKPTEEQQARLEELYGMVVGKDIEATDTNENTEQNLVDQENPVA